MDDSGEKPDLVKYQWKISGQEINSLPLAKYEGPVRIIDSPGQLDGDIDKLRKARVLGFDTETRPSFKKGISHPVSILQLATAENVYLFRLNRTGLPDEIIDILADPNIIKTGVAVADDIKALTDLADFEPAGFVDLGRIALKLKLLTNGLRNMTAKFLKIRISKGERCSNWNRDPLTDRQVAYAATDAWISRKLHNRMNELGLIDLSGNILVQ